MLNSGRKSAAPMPCRIGPLARDPGAACCFMNGRGSAACRHRRSSTPGSIDIWTAPRQDARREG
jgi:hypothetical protein